MANYTQYKEQLAAKKSNLAQILLPFNAPSLQVFASKDQHFRQRAEFKIWHEQNQINYAMFAPETKQPILLHQLPLASERINELMMQLAQNFSNSVLSERLFQAEFMSSFGREDALITLCYHRPLDEAWQQMAIELSANLQAFIIGRWRGHKIIIGQDFITEQFCVNGKTYVYEQPEGAFTQPNAFICSEMLNWTVQSLGVQSTDLLELYCGNGNFTLPLSACVSKVFATEISKRATQAAINNLERNQITNVKIVRLAAHEVSSALNKERDFYRLRTIDLGSYNFGTVLVDPPRSGLDFATCKMVQNFARIIYISCNPMSLQRDLQTLAQTHQITHCALFDQFPFSPHIECGLILQAK